MADRRLQVFQAVARNLSFTKAAEALCMTQPAVTFQIKQLEEQLNVRLFDRSRGRIALTAAGEVTREYAERILALSSELEAKLAEMSGRMQGMLLVGASPTIAEFMLPGVLGEFHTLYPQVRTRLTVAGTEAICERVADGVLDIGLVEAPPPVSRVESEVCCSDELRVVCAGEHPLALRFDGKVTGKITEIAPEVLLDYDFIALETGSGMREVTDEYFRAAGISPEKLKPRMEVGNPEALKNLVARGLGFTILPHASFEEEERLGLFIAFALQPRFVRNLSLIFCKEKFRSRVISTFSEFANRKLKELSH